MSVVATRDIIAGFAYGLLSMLAFGFYGLPRKLSRMSQRDFMACMSAGVFVATSLIGFPRVDRVWASARTVALSYLSGALWYLGSLLWIKAIDRIGYGSATAIKNTTCVFGTIVGIVVFNEYADAGTSRILLVILGSVLVSASATILGRLGTKRDTVGPASDSRNWFSGTALALGAAIALASYMLPGRFAGEDDVGWGWTYYCLLGQGVLLAGLTTYGITGDLGSALREPRRERLMGITAGLLYGVAFALMMTSMNLVGMAVGFSLANMNTIVVLPLSILVLREVDYHADRWHVLVGALCAVVGTVCLAASKGHL